MTDLSPKRLAELRESFKRDDRHQLRETSELRQLMYERDRLAAELSTALNVTTQMATEADEALAKINAAEATARKLAEIASELVDRKDTGASEDAHIFAEWDTLRDFLATAEVKALLETES